MSSLQGHRVLYGRNRLRKATQIREARYLPNATIRVAKGGESTEFPLGDRQIMGELGYLGNKQSSIETISLNTANDNSTDLYLFYSLRTSHGLVYVHYRNLIRSVAP
ncbi:hypothetical protein BGZ60DRAFT_524917 [Tricladium varicosporioides]|nr:hypothetical protein BGZ60DRAFT_524917 [Hymenoscyphus varicosporioides]